uniref:NADH-ubiquinone oxidoreductase chain 5 n=1 Tax=Drabescoides nuchalis TaxID=1725375 RepID=A0A0U2LB20_9HEMI|nr:NADH dehydrogenase subunit 5 [Drabescoides nuchalis]ALF99737.1 NADH dehydrogenase subunit 5 [Drabescoides nuchalis]
MLLNLNLYYIWSVFFFVMSLVFMMLSLNFLLMKNCFMVEWGLYSYNSVFLNFVVYLDWISMLFMFVVLFISSMVILYSSVYMGDYNYGSIRFLFLVLMFVFSMLLMILSPSLVSIMLGWDGLGLVSYCLVIYYSSSKSYLAGLITCLINRLGDIGLLISIAWIFSYGSWNFIFYNMYFSELIFYMIIVSSFTKSAQIPFSSWLPAAMAAPTPVSSLVHSSTLVTAGVYLLIRFHNLIIYSNYFFLYISIMTMIMSSFCANYEFDLKKIIALSTLSQLGLMMSCLFMGFVDLSYFHLLSHAMFKSLLFLCSGIIIHLMGGCQDIRMMGSICLVMPVTCCCFNISNMSLCGFPFLSGFYSKDIIVENSSFSGQNLLVWLLFYFGLGLTASYSIRLFIYSVLKNFNYTMFLSMSEEISYMKFSILFLSIFSITFGCLFVWLTNMDFCFLILPLYLKLLTLIIVMLGIYLGYELNFIKNFMFKNYYKLNGNMWFMYSYSYGLYLLNYSYSFSINTSMLWGEFYGGLGISYYALKVSNFLQFYSLGSLKIFFVLIILWMMIMM